MTNLQSTSKNKPSPVNEFKRRARSAEDQLLNYQLVEEGDATFFEITRIDTSGNGSPFCVINT